MKIFNHARLFGETNNTVARNNVFAEVVNETFNLSDISTPVKLELLQFSTNDIENLSPGIQILKNDRTPIPVSKPENYNFEAPVINMNKVNAEARPAFNFFIKDIGTCLSNIELAIDCYNVTSLQYSTQMLKNLFFEMKIPVISNLAMNMEGLAKENKFNEVSDLFRQVKKIIGRLVKEKNLR